MRDANRRGAVLFVLAGALLSAPPGGAAPPGPDEGPAAAPAARFWESIDVHGFLSASWSHGFNRPASRTNRLRAFDEEDGSIRLDVVQLAVGKEAATPGEAGFRVDAIAGSALPHVTAASGLFRDPATGEAEDVDLLQAFVSWVAPVGSGLKVDAGKFVTPVGYEAIEGYEAWNDHATHSFLFTASEPSTHTGLRAGYAFSDALSATVLLVNGWDDARDRNRGKTVGAVVTFTPEPQWLLSASLLAGPEREDSEADVRTHLGLVVQLKPDGPVGGGLSAERGREEGLAEDGGAISWWGVAGYVRWAVSPRLCLALRAERFEDEDGARTGTAQRLDALTFTPSFTLAPGLVVRADLRLDLSDQPAFEDEDGLLTKKRQPTLLLNALWAF